ncbi:MAG: hypothetical protein KGI49_00880 [Patescibacteria group bacterium]|nr:hypothetical protein [Patescibacteria group bacterium]
MIYRGLSNIENGSVLIDVILAIGLSTVMIAALADMSAAAEDGFERARSKAALMDALAAHIGEFDGMDVGERRGAVAGDIDVIATTKPYGNGRIETDMKAAYRGNDPMDGGASASDSVVFVKVSIDPSIDTEDKASGSPLCAADMDVDSPVGSYAFLASSSAASGVDIRRIDLPIDPLLPLTDIEVRDGIAYVSADSSRSSDPDIMSFDISDPERPRLLSSLDTGPGISSISVAGRYIYAAASSASYQLHTIKLESRSSMSMASRYRLPLPQASTTPGVGSAISYAAGKAYIGTEKWDGDEFSIIDVSDPEHPGKIGGYEIGSKVNDILIDGKEAFVAASGIGQLMELDIGEPSDPTLSASFSPSGWQRQDGKALYTFEGSLALGRTSGGYDVKADHELFQWPSMTEAAPYSSANVPGGVYGIGADRSHVFAATRSIDSEFSVYGRSLSDSAAYPLQAAPQAIGCDGKALYILAHTAPVIYEISISSRHDFD